jgi:threonine dehydrogenase-like Zn-dependent dehydrogenase
MAVVVAFAAATLIGLFALWLSARGAITICVLEVVDGRVTLAKGSLAPRVFADVEDIVKRPKVKSATLRLTRAKDFAKLEASGSLSKVQRQQLQNLVGNVPVAKLAGTRRGAGRA